jgi:hypothetical protein
MEIIIHDSRPENGGNSPHKTIELKNGEYAIVGQLQPPTRSKTGKTFIVASTNGFISVESSAGITYGVNLNITRKDKS